MKVRIEGTKNDAKSRHDKTEEFSNSATVTVYTDGSGIEGNIAAAIFKPTTNEVAYQHLGGEAQFNVYTAKLTDIHMGIKQLRNHPECQTGRIYTDS